MAEQEDAEHTSPQEYIKNTSTLEQFSLKTDCKLTEKLLAKAVRKTHKNQARREKLVRSGPKPLGGDSEGKMDYMGRDPPHNELLESHFQCPSPEV